MRVHVNEDASVHGVMALVMAFVAVALVCGLLSYRTGERAVLDRCAGPILPHESLR